MKKSVIALVAVLIGSGSGAAQQAAITKNDVQIDGLDPGIKIFIREKMAQGNTRFANDNVVLFLHGATSPSTCDFDLEYKDYSWANWLVNRGYVVYMGDYRNYGGSTREAAMDEPASKNQPVTRSYLALRDIEAMVNHIKRTRNVQKVTLIGWSWGAMMGGYYASLHSENVQKLVMYAPLYSFNDHTNLGPGSGLQNKRRPTEFNSHWAHIASHQRRPIPLAGTVKFRLITRTNIAIPPSHPPSGTNAWRLTPRATAERPRACVLQTGCSRIHSIRRRVGLCGMPPTYTCRPS